MSILLVVHSLNFLICLIHSRSLSMTGVCVLVSMPIWGIRFLHTRDDLLCHVRFDDAITLQAELRELDYFCVGVCVCVCVVCMRAHIDQCRCVYTHTLVPQSHISLQTHTHMPDRLYVRVWSTYYSYFLAAINKLRFPTTTTQLVDLKLLRAYEL